MTASGLSFSIAAKAVSNSALLLILIGWIAVPVALPPSSSEQGTHRATLVAAARLDPDRRDRAVTQLLDQFSPATDVVRHPRAVSFRQDHNVQTIFRHVDSAKREHLRIPSLLMRARAQA